MDSIVELGTVLRLLESTKCTERKKGIERLTVLLGKPSVVQSLDQTSDKKQGPGSPLPTWDSIMKVVISFMHLETDVLQKSKESASASSQAHREKKKRDLSCVFKFVVRTANKRGPRLKGTFMVKHILEILKNKFTCIAFGTNYSSVLLKNILDVRKYWVEFSSETWLEMLKLYCHLYMDSEYGVDRILVARILRTLAFGASQQCDFQPKKLLFFFTEVFNKIKEEKVMAVVEHLLGALNIVVRTIAVNSRTQICKLGESIIPGLLFVWNNDPSDTLKDHIVEFMQLQMNAHHPGGVKTADKGTFAVNWDIWQGHLTKLYEMIHMNLDQVGGRHKFSSVSRNSATKEHFIQLAADVYYQLYTEEKNNLEVNQISEQQGDSEMTVVTKKRRLMSKWSSVLDTIHNTIHTPQIIPWLQLLKCVLDKYPVCVVDMDTLATLKCLHEVLVICNRSETFMHTFQCLKYMAKSVHAVRDNLDKAVKDEMASLWNHVWTFSLSIISSRQAEAEEYQQHGFDLASVLIHCCLVKPCHQVWNLFLRDVTHPTFQSLTLLNQLLSSGHIPENYTPSILGSLAVKEISAFPLRMHLLDWLSWSLSHHWNRDAATTEVLIQILFKLMFKHQGQMPVPCFDKKRNISELEELYLMTTFDCILDFENKTEEVGRTDRQKNNFINPVIATAVGDVLNTALKDHLDFHEAQIKSLQSLSLDCMFLARCLEQSTLYTIEMASCGILLQQILLKFTILMQKYVKESTADLQSVIENLLGMFSFSDPECLESYQSAEAIRGFIPNDLINILLDLVLKKLVTSSKSASVIHITSKDISQNNYVLSEFDDASWEGTFQEENDTDNGLFDEEVLDRQEKEDGHQTAHFGLLDHNVLTETQSLRIIVLRFLCLLTGFHRDRAPGKVIPSKLDTEALKRKIEEVLTEENFDPTHAADVQMMDVVLNTLLSPDHFVTISDLEIMLDVLRRTAKAQYRDQKVCCLILSLMTHAARYLGQRMGDDSKLLECRDIMMHLLSIFWRFQSEGHCSSAVRLSLAQCMGVIAEHDPLGEWGLLKPSQQSDDGDGPAPTIVSKFPYCLIDGSLAVRLYMAVAIKRLFVTEIEGKIVPQKKHKQHEAFDLVYEICSDMMDIRGRLTPERIRDERWNRTVSLLLVLATTAIASPVCEKKALFAFCQVIYEKQIDMTPVNKIIAKMANALNYPDAREYLVCHLPFLVSQWLELDYPLNKFPYQILLCKNSLQFFSNHVTVLVPQLFLRKDMTAIQEIANNLQLRLDELLLRCFPGILVNILPHFASRSPKSEVQSTACYDLLLQQLGQETVEKNIMDQLGEIVVNILNCLKLRSNEDSNKYEKDNDPDPNPPNYSQEVVMATLDYMTKSLSGKTKSLVAVLVKTPDGIERVLLQLNVMFWHQHRGHERLRMLHMLQLLITMLLKELVTTKLGGAWAFFMRRVITTLLHILSGKAVDNTRERNNFQELDYQNEIILLSLRLLKRMCSAIIDFCYEELFKYLHHIIDIATHLVLHSNDNISKGADEMLRFLLIDNIAVLKVAISTLDPFPDLPVFKEINQHCAKWRATETKSLQKLVEQVLIRAKDPAKLPESFAKTLHHLSQAIVRNQQQLSHMLLDGQGSQTLRDLVSHLLHMTHIPVKTIAEAAACCLGTVGPLNLHVLALHYKQVKTGLHEALQMYSGDVREKYCHIFHCLHQYLVNPDMELVQISSVTLKRLLATSTGIDFSADYKQRLANKDFLFQYLHPFRSHNQIMPQIKSALSLHLAHKHINSARFWEADHGEYGRWIKDLCVAFIKSSVVTDEILVLLEPVCEMKVEFSEMLFPYLVHDVLKNGQTEIKEMVSKRLSSFFATHCRLATSHRATGDESTSICVKKESVRILLNVVNNLRKQSRPCSGEQRVSTAWDNNFWLDVNYLDIAWAALYCDDYFSAVLFAEIWCYIQRKRADKLPPDHQSTSVLYDGSMQDTLLSPLSILMQSSEKGGVQTLLLEALRCIGDPDAVYGCGAGLLPDPASRIETYFHEKRWGKAITTLDIQMQHPTSVMQLDLMRALQKYGAHYLLRTSLDGLGQTNILKENADMAELQYQAAWQAGQWDINISSSVLSTAPFHESIYNCLHAIRDGQPNLVLQIINNSRHHLLQKFDIDVDCCQNLYPLLSKLQCLNKIEHLSQAITSKDSQQALTSLAREWGQARLLEHDVADFEFLEPVQSLQLAAIRLLVSSQKYEGVRSALHDILLLNAKAACKAGQYQLAERYLNELCDQDGVSHTVHLHAQLQLAQLFWACSEHSTAKNVLKSLISRCEQLGETNRDYCQLLPTALGLYGTWLAETHSETPSVIMQQFLKKAVDLLESRQEKGQEAMEGYLSLARFADVQYQNIVNYMSSSTFDAKQVLMKRATSEFEKYKREHAQKDRYLRTLEKQTLIDQQEVAAMIADRRQFLLHALQSYVRCLQCGDAHDIRIFRLTSLWFDNSGIPEVDSVMQDCAEKLKSCKFLPLLHQLAARMGFKVKENQLFHPTLNRILERASVDHPYHTLWVLLALANAKRDEDVQTGGRSAVKRRGRMSTSNQGIQEEENRVQAAQSLLEHLKTNSKVAKIVTNMELLSTAYIQLANWSVEQYRKEPNPICLPKTLKLMTIGSFSNVSVPTLEVKVDPSCCYDNIIFITKFLSTFRLAGGINLPKIITCHCSDGIERRQLVKGRDDLRQDAVMQQVFGLVNRLLLHEPETYRRQLHIRTYKVVPLSRRSGLLEWCEGTLPLGEYLVGTPNVRGSGAHFRYHPNDWSYLDCRRRMMAVQDSADSSKKYSAFMEACHNFQPVFRFFFMEKFPEPSVWFQCRLAYTRSVATNSIVGYILGLGDRHVMNILIDCKTAELIHIDLGVAFEQGRILPTPETVPFRLTRDIVDGMGITGVEGVFRRCCEKTMEVMRGHKESLLTVLEVLLYDPLSEWSLSPQRALALQAQRDCDTTDLNVSLPIIIDVDANDGEKSDSSQEQVNKLAERVLLRLHQKLQGLEDGTALSVAGQVNHLIQSASDPHNLSRLYPGWQPYI